MNTKQATKHTDGPWKIDEQPPLAIITDDEYGYGICEVKCFAPDANELEIAQLIAAAPKTANERDKLLSAAKLVIAESNGGKYLSKDAHFAILEAIQRTEPDPKELCGQCYSPIIDEDECCMDGGDFDGNNATDKLFCSASCESLHRIDRAEAENAG